MTRPAARRALLATCVAAAVRGAEEVRAYAARLDTLEWEEKSRADFVSDADRASERVIREVVRGRHAEAEILGEELSPDLARERLAHGLAFVADPLDGTTNFLHRFPWYAVSIAALVDGVPAAGAVLNVPTGELFTAVAGGGARRNGQPIAVSRIADPVRALIGTGFPFKLAGQQQEYLPGFAAVTRQAAGVRRPGSAALDLADVACGRFDAFWELTLAPWDVAAGILLVREAGGIVTTIDGTPAPVAQTSIIAGNPVMHAWLLQTLRDA
ncbi:MAG TPA: inositol monophosphatase family protein [Gemmatimonadaceae bacterium]|nr:inositol monophosphatase family protein [Gemmatimonadaceae bacterium]